MGHERALPPQGDLPYVDAHGLACLDASFAVSAMRARECRLYSALSIIAPSVNVLRRTRRKPSTIRELCHWMSLSDNLGRLARAPERVPTGVGEVARPITPTKYTNDLTLTETKAFVSVLFLECFLSRSVEGEPGCQLYNHDFALGTNGDWSSH